MRHHPTKYPKKRLPFHTCPRLGQVIVAVDVAVEFKRCLGQVRFAPKGGPIADIAGRQRRAKGGHFGMPDRYPLYVQSRSGNRTFVFCHRKPTKELICELRK